MLWNTYIIDSSATNPCVKSKLVKVVPDDDESLTNAKRGIASYIHCLRVKFKKPETEALRLAVGLQYLIWTAIHLSLMCVLVGISQSDLTMFVVSSTLGLIILNGMAFTGIAILAASKYLKTLRYVCEWYVFCSQILFAFGSDSSPGIASVAKCAAQLAILSFALFCISINSHVPTAGIFTTVLAVFASVTVVFILHAISPYGSMLGVYVAIIYSLAWCLYMIHESFQWVLVREV